MSIYATATHPAAKRPRPISTPFARLSRNTKINQLHNTPNHQTRDRTSTEGERDWTWTNMRNEDADDFLNIIYLFYLFLAIYEFV